MITRNPNIPVPRYNLEEIMRLEGTELSPLSPLERRRLEKSIEELTKERDYWKSKVETVKSALA
ncbi:hypothetical protein [Clostridium butyricum]|nr:hypothetical protein [Clostridium butyricum]